MSQHETVNIVCGKNTEANRLVFKMAEESSQSDESINRKKPHQNGKQIESSDSDSSHVNSIARSTRANFDVLTIDTPSDNSMGDPLLVPLRNDESEEYTSEKGDEDMPNASVGRIKLVPLENLMPKKVAPIELSSTTSSEDEPIGRKISSPKKKLTKTRSTTRKSTIEFNDSDGSDSDVTVISVRRKTKENSTNKLPKNILEAQVKLVKLPANMEPLLKRYNLREICDADNVIASRKSPMPRKRMQRNEVVIMNSTFFCEKSSLFHCNGGVAPYAKTSPFQYLLVKTIDLFIVFL